MQMFYSADSERLSVEDIKDLNEAIFAGWDDGDMPFDDTDNLPDNVRIITDDEFLQSELEF